MGRGRGSRRRGQVPSLQRSALHQGLSPGPRLDFPPPSPSNERQSSTLMLRFYSCVPALSGDAPHWGRHSGGITHHTGGVPQGASHWGCHTGGITLGMSHWGCHTGGVTLGVSHWGHLPGAASHWGVTLGASHWGVTLGASHWGCYIGASHQGCHTGGVTLGASHRKHPAAAVTLERLRMTGIVPDASHWRRRTHH